RLLQFVALHHRPHGTVEDDDALPKKCFERMNLAGELFHEVRLSKNSSAPINSHTTCASSNKLTHHDAWMCFGDAGAAAGFIAPRKKTRRRRRQIRQTHSH